MDSIKENKIGSVIEEAMRSLKSIADVNTVVGQPYEGMDGSTIIPVSKVTIAYVAGGGEYSAGENAVEAYSKDSYPLSAGSGGFIQLTPIGFLASKNGELSAVPITESGGALEKLLKAVAEYIGRSAKDDKK